MSEKITEPTQTAQLTPRLSPQTQEAITMLNVRVNDLLTQLNTVLNLLVKENAELKQQLEQQKIPIPSELKT